MTQKEFVAMLTANPHLEVVRHPNPAGLGPRRFFRVEGKGAKAELVFMRPNPEPVPERLKGLAEDYVRSVHPPELPSYLTLSVATSDYVATPCGFTLCAGRIEYVFKEQTDGDDAGSVVRGGGEEGPEATGQGVG